MTDARRHPFFTSPPFEPSCGQELPAFDLFGTKTIRREWRSLEELKVLSPDGQAISTEDPKPTFISGFIVRQLVKEAVIDLGRA